MEMIILLTMEAQFYNNLAEHPNPPDLLALYNQLATLPDGGWTYFQDRSDIQ